jgi:hypothetical protein
MNKMNQGLKHRTHELPYSRYVPALAVLLAATGPATTLRAQDTTNAAPAVAAPAAKPAPRRPPNHAKKDRTGCATLRRVE